MDITASIVPKSDQINAEDLLSGPRTFTIDRVSAGSVEQPVDIHLVELPGRPYRPSKTMRRVIVNAWGPESSAYPGRRMTLYRDPKVKFGPDEVGGIKISHLSDIDKPVTLAVTVTRGKRAPHKVSPLTAAPTADDVAACDDIDTLRSWWKHATLRPLIQARIEVLSQQQPTLDGAS